MDLSIIYGVLRFDSFDDVVNWLCSGVPYFLISVFILNCVFNIFDTIIHLGGKS